MRRRQLIQRLGVALLAWPLAAAAQQRSRIWRLGVLETTPPALNVANFAAFRQELRTLGYTEGQNFTIDYRSADSAERFASLVAELVADKVDLLLVRGTPAALAARKATTTIPIVVVSVADPLTVVSSLAHPGGNITGFTSLVSELEPKRIELVRKILPGAKRIGALYNMSNPVFRSRWTQLEEVAHGMGMKPQLLDVRKREDLASAFKTAKAQHADVLVVGNDAVILQNRALITGLAAQHRLPAVYATRDLVDAGGLIAYAVSFPDLYRRSAGYVDKILKGTKPGDLPIEQPTKFDLVINQRAAKALGLSIPRELLLRADDVIQ